MKYLEIKAPAKINIGLNIVSKREDNFHNIETIFYPVKDLYDFIIFEYSEKFEFNLISNLDISGDNLIIKAKNILESYSKKKLNVKITLHKQIPVGAGLAGGSSDAATTLIALNEMFKLNITYNELMKIALSLGSDVPFFVKSKPAYAEGRGEILTFNDFYINKPILLINANIHISTAKAFSLIKPKLANNSLKNIFMNSKIDYYDFQRFVTNDFEEPIFKEYPILEKIKNELYKQGALFCLMSGSGSTIYGIFDNFEIAKKAKDIFPSDYFKFIGNVESEIYGD